MFAVIYMAYVRAVISVSLGVIATGWQFGWSLPAVAKLTAPGSSLKMTLSEVSWVVSLNGVGIILGALVTPFLTHRIGRKNALLCAPLPHIAGWTLVAVATSTVEFCIGAIIFGFGGGVLYTGAFTYFSEIAVLKFRGALTSCMTLLINTGILLASVVGYHFPIEVSSFVSACIGIVFGLLLLFITESPYYMIEQGDYESAEKNLMKLRNKKDVHNEFSVIVKKAQEDTSMNKAPYLDLFLVPSNRKALIFLTVTVITVCFSGGLALFTYGLLVFNSFGVHWSGGYFVLIQSSLQILGSISILFVVDRFDWRRIILISFIIALFSLLGLTCYFFLLESGYNVGDYCVIPMICYFLYTFIYSFGCRPILDVITAELFPTSVRASAAMHNVSFLQISIFCGVKLLGELLPRIGWSFSFLIFSVFTSIGIINVCVFMPKS